MKSLILFSVLFASSLFAADRNQAYDLVCRPMTFQPDRAQCLQAIENARYFNDRALKTCANVDFDSEKISCLRAIADKNYQSYEIDTCANQTFDSEKISCFQQRGTSINGPVGCISKGETLAQLQNAKLDLSYGNAGSTMARIDYLINRYSNPNCR